MTTDSMYWVLEVCFHDGLAWSTELIKTMGPDGKQQWDAKPICLGKEADILPILKGKAPIPDDIEPKRGAVLKDILERSAHERADTITPSSSRELRAVKTRNQRIRPFAYTKHGTSSFGQTEVGRRLSCSLLKSK